MARVVLTSRGVQIKCNVVQKVKPRGGMEIVMVTQDNQGTESQSKQTGTSSVKR
jgi:hypothetical protein